MNAVPHTLLPQNEWPPPGSRLWHFCWLLLMSTASLLLLPLTFHHSSQSGTPMASHSWTRLQSNVWMAHSTPSMMDRKIQHWYAITAGTCRQNALAHMVVT